MITMLFMPNETAGRHNATAEQTFHIRIINFIKKLFT